MRNLEDLFLDSLADIYYAEQQLVKALPRLVRAATNGRLQEIFESHLTETEGHVRRLEEVFAVFDQEPKSKKCRAIHGIIEEVDEIAADNKKSPTINAALIYAAQKAEHYEIAAYGTLRDWARMLDNDRAADIIEEILDEEKAVDSTLTDLAEEECNQAAKVAVSGEP